MNAQPLPGKKKKAAVAIALPYWLREFALIRLAVVTCAGTLGISAAAVFASNWYLLDAREYQAQAQQLREDAYSRFAHVESEKQDIRQYQPQFMVLQSKGLIGEEDRLSWVEAIRAIQGQRQLLPISYEIAPQQPVSIDGPVAMGDYLLRGSRMQLHMDLLHEMDLFNFLYDLKQRSYYTVQDCTLKRLAGAANLPTAPTLSADCTLDWLTMTPAAVVKQVQRKRGRP